MCRYGRFLGASVCHGTRSTARASSTLMPRNYRCGCDVKQAAGLANKHSPPHAPAMFVVTEADAAAIRAVYERRGEFAAAIELRRLFPGITDNAQARECARTIAGWSHCRCDRCSGCRRRRDYVGCSDGGRLPNATQSGQRGSASFHRLSRARISVPGPSRRCAACVRGGRFAVSLFMPQRGRYRPGTDEGGQTHLRPWPRFPIC